MNNLNYKLILTVICCLGMSILFVPAYGQSGTGQLEGYVKTSAGEVLPYANVILSGTHYGATTDDSGHFTITNIPEGSYTLLASLVGFKKQSRKVIITSGTTRSVAIVMDETATNLQGVEIAGSREKFSETLNKIDVPLADLPVTANSISREILFERGVNDLGEAVKNATNVRPINRYGGFQTFHIRGFNNFVLLVDGVRDERHNISTSAPSTNLANVDHIEVLKGPASVLFGHSALGGVINIVRNQPTEDFQADFQASYGSFNTRRLQAGASGPINDKLRYRVDFGMSDSEGWRDYGVNTNNFYVALQYQPTSKDLFDIRIGANKDHYDTDTGLPVLEDGSLVPGMSIEARYNDPQDFLNHTRYDYQIRYERQLSEHTRLSEQISYYDDDIDYFSTESLSFNASYDSLTRSYPYYFNHQTKPFQNQIELTHDFTTGSVHQKMLVGYSLSIMDRKTYGGDIFGPAKYATIAVKNPILNQGYLDYEDTKYQAKMENVHGFYIQDWLDLGTKWKALVGLRYDVFRGTYFTDSVDVQRHVTYEGEETEMNKGALSYRAGLVFDPLEALSFYAGYSTYFKPSRTITGEGEVFDPEKGYQAEIGSRIQPGDKLSANISGFYIRKYNMVESLGGGEYRQIGEADSKGVELELTYQPINGLSIHAGYSYTDIQVREYDGDEENSYAGNRIAFAPDHLANVWANYSIPYGALEGFGVGAGYNYTGKNYTNSANTYYLPAYALFDAALFYHFGKGEIRFNVKNLADKTYFRDAIMSNQFFPGEKRNYMLTFKYQI